MLENCGIDDQELRILLKGFERLNNFTTFVYKNSVFMD